MHIEVVREPILYLKLTDVFGKDINKNIYDEAVKCKDSFSEGTTLGQLGKKYRDNLVLYYDTHYLNNRNKSPLLNNINKLFSDAELKSYTSSAGYPLSTFGTSNKHETQVSRYGNDNFYTWHVDGGATPFARTVSFVYHFFKEPKKWTGGELQFTKSIIHDGKMVEDMPIATIIPENDTGYIFPAGTAHRVQPTDAPEKFEDGRFSVNCWIGYNLSRFVGKAMINGY